MLRPYFGCESDLINLLLQSGLGEERVLELFWQHRTSYVSPIDFARIRSLVRRVPRARRVWADASGIGKVRTSLLLGEVRDASGWVIWFEKTVLTAPPLTYSSPTPHLPTPGALGLKKIRLPLTWCINYDQPYRIKGKTFGGQDQEVLIGTVAAIVKDPFENDPAFNPKGMGIANDRWVSIPIQVVEHVLEVSLPEMDRTGDQFVI